jgi:Zn-dependent metalloprotease
VSITDRCVHSQADRPCCLIAPLYLLARIAEEGDPEARNGALHTLTVSAGLRAQRAVVGHLVRQLGLDVAAAPFLAPQPGAHVSAYDAKNGGDLPGTKMRGDGDPASADEAVNQAYDGAETTYGFYKDLFGRDSVDNKALELVSSVHYSTDFDNAFWNGSQMVYGDGSGRLFEVGGMTKAIDVIGHELTHGVTQFTAGLHYAGQSGALNESISDVFGSLVKQRTLGQTADQADWLIGAGILGPALQPGVALRSMKAPGTAHKFDQQPADMSAYMNLPIDDNPRNDHGGVHINSGIPNRAFQLAATAIGGNAWEKAGKIWYVTLTQHLQPDSDFRAAADATVAVAGELFGAGGAEEQAIHDAWQTVGVL